MFEIKEVEVLGAVDARQRHVPRGGRERAEEPDVTFYRIRIRESINHLIQYWKRNIDSAFATQLDIVEVRISLKHFLEDMYSVANYVAILRKFPENADVCVLPMSTIRNIYPNFREEPWISSNFYAPRLRGSNALRNIGAHRSLPEIVVDETNEGHMDFVSVELNDDERNASVFTRTQGTFQGIVGGLVRGEIIEDPFKYAPTI